jgi:predicted transcriptional regulator
MERMIHMRLSENEFKIMEIIWDEKYLDEKGEIIAKKVSDMLIDKYGWSKRANYVYFSRLLEKGVISRRYPNYTIRALVKREDIVNEGVKEIIDRTCEGSVLNFFRGFIRSKEITKEDIDGMQEIINSFNSDHNGENSKR